MNHSYRLIWSRRQANWVPVAEIYPGRAKCRGASLKPASALLALLLLACSSLLQANPSGGQVVAGSASIEALPAVVTVTQSTDKAIINWQDFSIGQGELTRFVQPSSSSVTLNRVIGVDPSQILGSLHANGNIFLVNRNGILFGPNAVIDVQGLVASTHDISDSNFMAGNYRFDLPGRPDASILNQGQISIRDAGLAAFVAPRVRNDGVIQARLGRVALAAGTGFSLDLYGDQLLELMVDSEQVQDLLRVEQSGRIEAETVLLTAGTAREVVNSVINMDGVIEARSARQEGGRIILGARQGSKLEVSGTLDASSATGRGGQIQVTGEEIHILPDALLNASGATGGGEVLVGGDWQGQGDLFQASQLSFAAGASIDASALQQGDGGTLVLWSDIHNPESFTLAQGRLSAQGGLLGGNGGRIETSGYKLKLDGISVSTAAPMGEAGEWLIDPYDIYIASPGNISTIGPLFTSTADSTFIDPSVISTALALGNVTIQTGNGGAQPGDIIVWDDMLYDQNQLTLKAHNNIEIYAHIIGGDALGPSTSSLVLDAQNGFIYIDPDLAAISGVSSTFIHQAIGDLYANNIYTYWEGNYVPGTNNGIIALSAPNGNIYGDSLGASAIYASSGFDVSFFGMNTGVIAGSAANYYYNSINPLFVTQVGSTPGFSGSGINALNSISLYSPSGVHVAAPLGAPNVDIYAGQDISNQSSITAFDTLHLSAEQSIINFGSLNAGSYASLYANLGSVENYGSISGTDLYLSAGFDIFSQGRISASSSAWMEASYLIDQYGTGSLLSAPYLFLHAGEGIYLSSTRSQWIEFDNSHWDYGTYILNNAATSGSLYVSGWDNSYQGVFVANNGPLQVPSGYGVSSWGDIFLTSVGNLTVNGMIDSFDGDIYLTADSSGNLSINGGVYGYRDIFLTALGGYVFGNIPPGAIVTEAPPYNEPILASFFEEAAVVSSGGDLGLEGTDMTLGDTGTDAAPAPVADEGDPAETLGEDTALADDSATGNTAGMPLDEGDSLPPAEGVESGKELPAVEETGLGGAMENLDAEGYTPEEKAAFFGNLSEDQVVADLEKSGDKELAGFYRETAAGGMTNEAQLIALLQRPGVSQSQRVGHLGVFARMRQIGMTKLMAPALDTLKQNPAAADVIPDGRPGAATQLRLQENLIETDTGLALLQGQVESESKLLNLRVNGRWAYVDEQGNYQVPLPVRQGENRVVVEVTDPTGTLSSTEVIVRSAVDGRPQAPEGRKVALFIGVEEYDNAVPELQTPLNDARAIAAKLQQQQGYDPMILENPSKQEILETLKQVTSQLNEGDNLVVYYAGHGYRLQETGRGYWLPRDADPKEPTNWVSNRDIARIFHRTPAKQIMLVTDSCYSGAFTGARAPSETTDQPGQERLRAVMAMSSGGDQPVWDGGGDGHSIFASKFMQALDEQPQRGLDLYRSVREKVTQDAPQVPGYGAMLVPGYDDNADFSL